MDSHADGGIGSSLRSPGNSGDQVASGVLRALVDVGSRTVPYGRRTGCRLMVIFLHLNHRQWSVRHRGVPTVWLDPVGDQRYLASGPPQAARASTRLATWGSASSGGA